MDSVLETTKLIRLCFGVSDEPWREDDRHIYEPDMRQELPKGFQIISTEKHGASHWGQTGRINMILSDGTLQSFFIKVIPREFGRSVTRGEYQSMKTIHDIVPDFVPNPMAFGTYDRAPDTHFFLCKFREMTDQGISGSMPDPQDFGALLSTLHENSISPTGKFGFHVTTYAGNLPQFVGWEDSWETFFTKSMRQALDLEIAIKGPSEELVDLSCVLFEKVIPRLLRPLESDGRFVIVRLAEWRNEGRGMGLSRIIWDYLELLVLGILRPYSRGMGLSGII